MSWEKQGATQCIEPMAWCFLPKLRVVFRRKSLPGGEGRRVVAAVGNEFYCWIRHGRAKCQALVKDQLAFKDTSEANPNVRRQFGQETALFTTALRKLTAYTRKEALAKAMGEGVLKLDNPWDDFSEPGS